MAIAIRNGTELDVRPSLIVVEDRPLENTQVPLAFLLAHDETPNRVFPRSVLQEIRAAVQKDAANEFTNVGSVFAPDMCPSDEMTLQALANRLYKAIGPLHVGQFMVHVNDVLEAVMDIVHDIIFEHAKRHGYVLDLSPNKAACSEGQRIETVSHIIEAFGYYPYTRVIPAELPALVLQNPL